MRGGLDRFTPDVARDMAANLEGTSREDILDPATWKGLAYMLAYSAQFQAGQDERQAQRTAARSIKTGHAVGNVGRRHRPHYA